MGRKCSHCGNIGHNSRTCTISRGTNSTSGVGGVKLFGVQLETRSSSCNNMNKSFSMDCLSSCSNSPSSSLSSTRISIDENSEKSSICYLSDGLMTPSLERKKGVPWTEDEHRVFLIGLEKLGKGDWRGISRNFVTTRTPTQVASHAQKYFLRQSTLDKKKRRSSLFDMVSMAGLHVNTSKFHHHHHHHHHHDHHHGMFDKLQLGFIDSQTKTSNAIVESLSSDPAPDLELTLAVPKRSLEENNHDQIRSSLEENNHDQIRSSLEENNHDQIRSIRSISVT